jgi:solute carrier family 25 (mitochondrial carnitine/acylcarnitine transporter), member 20/29
MLISIDIVKVRLQTTTQYTGALDAATKIYKSEGPLAFYKGTLTPLIGIGACVRTLTPLSFFQPYPSVALIV